MQSHKLEPPRPHNQNAGTKKYYFALCVRSTGNLFLSCLFCFVLFWESHCCSGSAGTLWELPLLIRLASNSLLPCLSLCIAGIPGLHHHRRLHGKPFNFGSDLGLFPQGYLIVSVNGFVFLNVNPFFSQAPQIKDTCIDILSLGNCVCIYWVCYGYFTESLASH